MNDSAVTNCDILSDNRWVHPMTGVNEDVLLKIRASTNHDRLDISTKHHIEKDRDVLSDLHVADYPGVRGYKS